MKVDFIIVGQGLAGTLLTHELLVHHKSVAVFDDPDSPKASDVAAGQINPVIFRRMTKSWMADEAFDQMELTYRQLENLLQDTFYFPTSIHLILSEDETVLWNGKRISNQLEKFINPAPERQFSHPKLVAPFGTGEVKKAGRLDMQKLTQTFSEYLSSLGMLYKRKFQTEKLEINAENILYENLEAGKIIFCEGKDAEKNPFFRNLKFKSSKGEVLELRMPELNLAEIVSREIFVMPVGNHNYKVGATYQWSEIDTETTEAARIELLEKLKSLTSANSEVRMQKAGVRPTMHDRKPVMGLLPDVPQIGIFNGLGSKGALLGPYFARKFALFLSGKSDFIPPEVNIQRYFRKK